MLSLALGLEGEHCLDAFCSYHSVEYGAQIILNRRIAPRPRLGDAQGQGAKLHARRFALSEDALDDLVASQCSGVSDRIIKGDAGVAVEPVALQLMGKTRWRKGSDFEDSDMGWGDLGKGVVFGAMKGRNHTGS